MSHAEILSPQVQHIQKNFVEDGGIIDCLLREGEQFAGTPLFHPLESEPPKFQEVAYTKEDAANYLYLCHLIGIDIAETPNPLAEGMTPYVEFLVSQKNRPELASHIRNNIRDARAAIATGVEGISILTTVDPDRLMLMNVSKDQYHSTLAQVVKEAKEHGLKTRVSVEHAWNVDFNKALEMYQLAEQLGVDRLGFADTLGTATPWEVAEKIAYARKILQKILFEVHFHDDAGCAVINAIAALDAGANYVNTTPLGIGERNGITPLSGLAVRLVTMHPSLVKNYSIEYVTRLERYVADLLHMEVPHNLPTSFNAFVNKSGIHLSAMAQLGQQIYLPYNPGIIGNEAHYVTGSRISGKTKPEQLEGAIYHNRYAVTGANYDHS